MQNLLDLLLPVEADPLKKLTVLFKQFITPDSIAGFVQDKEATLGKMAHASLNIVTPITREQATNAWLSYVEGRATTPSAEEISDRIVAPLPPQTIGLLEQQITTQHPSYWPKFKFICAVMISCSYAQTPMQTQDDCISFSFRNRPDIMEEIESGAKLARESDRITQAQKGASEMLFEAAHNVVRGIEALRYIPANELESYQAHAQLLLDNYTAVASKPAIQERCPQEDKDNAIRTIIKGIPELYDAKHMCHNPKLLALVEKMHGTEARPSAVPSASLLGQDDQLAVLPEGHRQGA
jgi:hypothetical protein